MRGSIESRSIRGIYLALNEQVVDECRDVTRSGNKLNILATPSRSCSDNSAMFNER